MAEVARRLVGLMVGGDPQAWSELGFEVEAHAFRTGGVTVRLDPDAPPGVRAWAIEPTVHGPVDGLPSAPVAPAPEVEHPNQVTALDHLVVTTSDLDRTTSALERLGMVPRREVRGLPGRGETIFRFFLMGTCLLELIGPLGSEDGARITGLAFVVGDLDGLAGRLGDRLGEVRDAIQPGRRIASVRRDAGLPIPVAFMTPRS